MFQPAFLRRTLRLERALVDRITFITLCRTIAMFDGPWDRCANAKKTSSECELLWTKAAAAGASGNLTQMPARSYVRDLKRADVTGTAACPILSSPPLVSRGMVRDTASTGPGSGRSSTGAGSSTEQHGCQGQLGLHFPRSPCEAGMPISGT